MDLTLVLTHDCNLGCGYCYAGAKFRRAMDADIAERSLDLAFAEKPRDIEVSFFGGEPLLEWDLLVRSAESARDRSERCGTKLKMSVTTNGTLLTDERVRRLDELGVYVGLSIDGVQPAHDAGRPKMGGGSSFREVERGLLALLRHGKPFETISVVSPANVRSLGASVRWLFELGVPRVGLNPCYEAYFSDADLNAYEAGLEEAADCVIGHFRHARIVSLTVFDNKILAALKGGLVAGDKCSLGATSIAVAPSGNIYPCEREVGEDEDATHRMGNVRTGLDVRGPACAPGPVNSECTDCGERWRCSSFCACANKAETGRTDVAGGTQCWHEQTSARIADRIAETLWSEQNEAFLAWFYGRMASFSGALATEAPEQPTRVGKIKRRSGGTPLLGS